MMYGESSWLVGENGRDMQFNPTPNFTTPLGDVLFGGKHFVYVFRHSPSSGGCPAYDGGEWIYNKLRNNGNYNPNAITQMKVFGEIMWTGIPLSVKGKEWLNNDVTIQLRVTHPYERYMWGGASAGPNNGWPSYGFTTRDIATEKSNNEQAKSALDLISVVPNPYYAYSDYETSQLDNRVKIVNLPVKCTIKIYTINGTLIRTITKDNDMTSVDWDLKNHAAIPISSGTYLIHVDAPGIGEKVIKWFGVIRQVDLNAF